LSEHIYVAKYFLIKLILKNVIVAWYAKKTIVVIF